MHDCPCCGDDIIYSDDPEELCQDCKQAGCEANDNEDSENYGIFDDCKVRELACPECDTNPSFLNDGKWHTNCEPEDCAREAKEGPQSWSP